MKKTYSLFILSAIITLLFVVGITYAIETSDITFGKTLSITGNPVSSSANHQILYTNKAKVGDVTTDAIKLYFMNNDKSSLIITKKAPVNCNSDLPIPHPEAPQHLVIFKGRVYPSNAEGTCFSYLRGDQSITYGDFFPGCNNTPFPTACMTKTTSYTSGFGEKDVLEQSNYYLNMESFLANKCSQIPEKVREININKWTVIPENQVYPRLNVVSNPSTDCTTLVPGGCIQSYATFTQVEANLLNAIFPIDYNARGAGHIDFPWRYYPDTNGVMRDDWGSVFVPNYYPGDGWIFYMRSYINSPGYSGYTITPSTPLSYRFNLNTRLRYLTTLIISRAVDTDIDKCKFYGY